MRESDDWPTVNLFVRRDLFLQVGGFDNGYWPGEDTRFCLALAEAGHRVLYDPDLVVWHHRRPLFAPHLKQVGAYGLHRGHFARKFPRTSRRLGYLAPTAFLLFVLLGWLPALWLPSLAAVWGSILAIYALGSLLDAWRVARTAPLTRMVWLGIAVTHLWYGLRFLQGFFTPNLKSRLR